MNYSDSQRVKKLYQSYPFPNYPIKTKSDLYKTSVYELIYPLVKPLIKSKKNIKILEVGCGTGELSLGLSQKNITITAIDFNKLSLKIAQQKARKLKIKNVAFRHANLNHDAISRENFDVILAIGVLHHNKKIDKLFKKLVSMLGQNGYLVVGLYNPYGRFKVRMVRILLKLYSNNNFSKIANLIYILKGRNITDRQMTYLLDRYANPLEKYYSVNQVKSLVENNNLKYVNSNPPIELFKNFIISYKFIKLRIFKQKPNLVKISGEVANQELNSIPKFSFATQVLWLLIGKGEMVTYVAQKK